MNVQGDEVVKGGKRGTDGTNATCTVAAPPSSTRTTRTDDGVMAEPSSPGASSVGGGAGSGGGASPTSHHRRGSSGGSVRAPQPASGGQGGKGLLPHRGEHCAALVSASSLRRFGQVSGYAGRFGGGDAAASYTLSRPNQPTVAHYPPSFLAGGGGGGGYSGGGGGALSGGGGGSFADRGACVL
jgi:loricrin